LSSYFLSQLPRLFARLDEQFVPPLLKPIQQGPQHRPVAFVGAATPITLAPPRPIGCGSLGEGRGAIAAVWPPWHRSSYPVTRHGYNGLVATINSICLSGWRHGRDGQTFARGKLLHCEIFRALRVSIVQGRALILAGSSLPTSHPAGRCPTTVPHSGRESSRRAAPLCKTALARQAGQRRRPLGSVRPGCRATRAQLLGLIRTPPVSSPHLPGSRPEWRTATRQRAASVPKRPP
jgi:hypothetical protein